MAIARLERLDETRPECRGNEANVTHELADQMFDALQILLRGFESAAERDGRDLIEDALNREHNHLYKGLLTVLLRLLFVLYAEARGLLPVDHPVYEMRLSVMGLFETLQRDHGNDPNSMVRRFGAWSRLIDLFRVIFSGVSLETLRMPPRHGSLFDPQTYPFLEGSSACERARVDDPKGEVAARRPSVDDETVYQMLEKLLVFQGQRLSYRALDVEQIGGVYEALMGYHVVELAYDAICMRPYGLWVTAKDVLEVPAVRRARWIKYSVGLSTAQAEKLAQEVAMANGHADVLGALAKYAAGGRGADRALMRAKARQLVLQPGAERRRTSSHYTPRSLSAPIVQRTLEPLLAVMGQRPGSERILHLKICDPAMGSGTFLVEACRLLADYVVAGWTHEDQLDAITRDHGDPVMHARRLVAQRCLVGVDKNEAAVELAKLSLWLVTGARDLPFTFVDHALCHGDSLVGLDFDQIRAFHWKPTKPVGPLNEMLDKALEVIAVRQGILRTTPQEEPTAQGEQARLLWDAEDALERVRLVADVVVGAFFAHDNDKEREQERERRLDRVIAWLRGGLPKTDELKAMQAEIRRRIPLFHWMLELPHVFDAERPDPLDDKQINRAAHIDAFVGNPPFLGGSSISSSFGHAYLDWMLMQHRGAHGNGDLCAHFFRRARGLLGAHGSVGFIATNTIAQGDTRMTGLQPLLGDGGFIYDATRSMPWLGDASVAVAVVHIAFGDACSFSQPPRLDGTAVPYINSRLRGGHESSDPTRLHGNTGCSFLGAKISGQGFLLTPNEAQQVPTAETGRVRPYLGGEDVNSHPRQEPTRFVMDLDALDYQQASTGWPTLLRLIEQRVKPERQMSRLKDLPWWRFERGRPELFAAIACLQRCLVTSVHSKHLLFSFQPTNRVFSHAIDVFVLDTYTAFVVLQSRIHEPWARLLSSSLEDRLRYVASDCFETFPFPQPDPRMVIPQLEDIGQHLYDFRAQYMVDHDVGLTMTYNRLKDPACNDPKILELRRLHEQMDHTVLDAYTWTDLAVPPYCASTDDDRLRQARFEDEVIDRLFVLNAKRAQEEAALGLRSAKGTGTGTV